MQLDECKARIGKWLTRHFPERQIYLRTEDETRFLVVSTRIQVGLVALALLATGWITVTSANFLLRDEILADKEQTIAELQEAYSRAANDMRGLQLEVIERTRELEARQDFLESLARNASPADIETGREPAAPDLQIDENPEESEAPEESLEFLSWLSAVPHDPERVQRFRAAVGARFEALEKDQTRLAMRLTGLASARLHDLEASLEGTGLEIADLIQTWNGHGPELAAGGPYFPAPEMDGIYSESWANEPAFLELARRWAALEKSQQSLASMPTARPAADYYISSRFGRRRDPINRASAVHYGLDMAGWPGTSVLAAASGLVTKAGWSGPYGQMIEIDHGNGFKTRYGHLKRITVDSGEKLSRGQKIGEMGCSGRCTSTHLHYEVWFGGKVQNPLPYLKVAKNVHEIQRPSKERNDAVHINPESSPASE